MAAVCGVRDRADAWLDDPDAVNAEFDALIAENFPAEPPDLRPGPTPPAGGSGPRRNDRRRSLRISPTDSALTERKVARERSPPSTA